MELSKRMLYNKKVSLGTVWEPSMTREEVAAEVLQLEATLRAAEQIIGILEGEPCSICGSQPALLIDAKEKATYWMCAECMLEKVLIKMELEAKLEAITCLECEKSMLECECDDTEELMVGDMVYTPEGRVMWNGEEWIKCDQVSE